MKGFVKTDMMFQAVLVSQIILWPVLYGIFGFALVFWTPLLLIPLGIIQLISACIGFFKAKKVIYGYYLMFVCFYAVTVVWIFPMFDYPLETLSVAALMGLAYFALTWWRLYEEN